MKKIIAIVIVIAVIALVATIYFYSRLDESMGTTAKPDTIKIGFSLGTSREERWLKDTELFTKRAQELGATVDVKYSNEDAKLQISQAENLIIQGVKALVVVPNDAATAAEIVERAHVAGVKVIAYDRMITGSTVDLYVTFDSRKVGEMEAKEISRLVPKGTYAYVGGGTTDNNAFLHKEGAMRVLDPLIKDGTIKLAVDEFSPDWRPEEAYRVVKNYLATGKSLDAVVAANDGTAGGVIRALEEFNLAGKVPVSGQDADLSACQRLVAGTQAVTIYKPLKNLAYKAAEAAVAFAKGETADVNGTLNNGRIDVPSYFLEPILVTKDNLNETVIKDGFHTTDEIYGASANK